MPRRSLLVPLGVLIACLVAVPACKKKPVPAPGEDPVTGPTVSGPGTPAAVSSDYVLYAHLRAKDIRDSVIFAEVKQALVRSEGTAEWDKVEGEASESIGVKPTDIDAVTLCVTEFPDRGEPKFVLILTASKPLDKTRAFKLKPGTKPDTRGLYPLEREIVVHFPDDKTGVVMHTDLVQKYLDGYAKNRTGWPLTAELSKAAAGHTAFVTLQLDKLPADARDGRDMKEFAPLLAARAVTLTADLKGKELNASARATFADAAAAGKGKAKADELIQMATGEVEKYLNGKIPADVAPFVAVVKEAHRALKAVKVEASGADLIASASYKADFDIGKLVADAVKQIRETGPRITASNNLKHIALAMHSYASGNNDSMPVHGIGPKGALLRNPNEKPLLSWRVAILPYIEQDNLYRQFKLDEPWDSTHNKKLIELMPKTYAPVAKPGKPGYTHMQMVIGPQAMSWPANLKSTFTDGTSNTIAVVEAAEPVIWTKPDDVMLPGNVQPKDFRKKFGGQFPNGFHVALWDGSVRFVPDTVSDKTLGHALTPAGGEVLGSDW